MFVCKLKFTHGERASETMNWRTLQRLEKARAKRAFAVKVSAFRSDLIPEHGANGRIREQQATDINRSRLTLSASAAALGHIYET